MSTYDRLPAGHPARQSAPLLLAASVPKTMEQHIAVDALLDVLFTMSDPDETLTKLGISRQDLRALDGDDEITAACDTRREAVIATPWRLEPGTGRAIKWIWAELEPHIEQILRQSWAAVPYGYSVQEIIYRRTPDGRTGIASVHEKPFEWFSFRPDGTFIWLGKYHADQQGVPVFESFPGKFLLTRYRETYRNPFGEALYARLYWPWLFRTNGLKFWAKTLERVGTPFLKGTAPLGNQPDGTSNVDALSAVLAKAVANTTLALPDGWQAEFMSAAQTGSSFEQFEIACIKRMQRLILGQTLTSDTQGTGSYALGQVHNEVRIDRRNADIRLATRTVQTLIGYLWEINRFSGDPPRYVMEDGQGLEPERAARDAQLKTSGIVARFSEDYLLRVYDYEAGDFEVPAEQAEMAGPATEPSASAPTEEMPMEEKQLFAAPHVCGMTFGADGKPIYTPEQQIVEDFVAEAVEKAGQPLADAAIQSAIRGARNPEDLERRLAAALGAIENSRFTEMLERALFAADIIGYVHAEE